MNTAYFNKEHFQQDNISTRLSHLAAHLTQIQSLTLNKGEENEIVSYMRQSLYFIEWTVPELAEIDIDKAAFLVDLGRTVTRWQHNWNKIHKSSDSRTEIADIAGKLSKQVREMSANGLVC